MILTFPSSYFQCLLQSVYVATCVASKVLSLIYVSADGKEKKAFVKQIVTAGGWLCLSFFSSCVVRYVVTRCVLVRKGDDGSGTKVGYSHL